MNEEHPIMSHSGHFRQKQCQGSHPERFSQLFGHVAELEVPNYAGRASSGVARCMAFRSVVLVACFGDGRCAGCNQLQSADWSANV